jgi:hypothetical protein
VNEAFSSQKTEPEDSILEAFIYAECLFTTPTPTNINTTMFSPVFALLTALAGFSQLVCAEVANTTLPTNITMTVLLGQNNRSSFEFVYVYDTVRYLFQMINVTLQVLGSFTSSHSLLC